jgi:hypothetical protein
MAGNALYITGDTIYTKSKNVKYKRNCNNCGKPYVGWGKFYCKPSCRIMPKLENSPSWKGDAITFMSGRDRARKIYGQKPCEQCGKEKTDIHHIDGNPVNNERSNVMFLCRKHHVAIEKRYLHMLAARGLCQKP